VLSDAARALTTHVFIEAKDKTIGRAEAPKRSMVAFMNTPQKAYFAHPMFWAPYSIVGEGG
jgi:CHAT domain-containing protein